MEENERIFNAIVDTLKSTSIIMEDEDYTNVNTP